MDVGLLKRATAFFAKGTPVNVYPFIDAQKRAGKVRGRSVARACELLKVFRSAYFAHADRQAAGGSSRERTDAP